MTLSLIPEILNTVYMVSTLCKQVRVIDTNMVKTAHIEHVITLQRVCIYDAIWNDFLRTALAGTHANPMNRPDGIVDLLIDKTTGALATPGDPNADFEYFRTENARGSTDAQLPGVELNEEETEELSTETIF